MIVWMISFFDRTTQRMTMVELSLPVFNLAKDICNNHIVNVAVLPEKELTLDYDKFGTSLLVYDDSKYFILREHFVIDQAAWERKVNDQRT